MRPSLTLYDSALARGFYQAGLWQDNTFHTLLVRNTAALPESIALRNGRKMLTWGALKARVELSTLVYVTRGAKEAMAAAFEKCKPEFRDG